MNRRSFLSSVPVAASLMGLPLVRIIGARLVR